MSFEKKKVYIYIISSSFETKFKIYDICQKILHLKIYMVITKKNMYYLKMKNYTNGIYIIYIKVPLKC